MQRPKQQALMFLLGLLMRGTMFSPQTGDLLTTVIYVGGFLGDLGSGIFYLLTAMLGYNHVTSRVFAGAQTGTPASTSYFLYGLHAGARYYFAPKIAAFAEVGYGMGTAQAGLSFKL